MFLFNKKKTEPLGDLLTKVKAITNAIIDSRISIGDGELPELGHLQFLIIHCNTLAKDGKEPYENRLEEALGKFPAIYDYFQSKPNKDGVIAALNQLEGAIKKLLPSSKPKTR